PIPSRLRMNSVELSELTQVTVDQTPYILYPGDKVRFDHKDDDILVNGESIMGVKNHPIRKAFGASFFKIKKGYNSIIIYPRDTFDAEAKWSDKYLRTLLKKIWLLNLFASKTQWCLLFIRSHGMTRL